ncbi:CPXCG motif-containing cysteine-rich protein [Flavobacteriales bacterium]|nr:CPXCG motif-containing cysteine-rich protein [Flavobacteriales bacterium]
MLDSYFTCPYCFEEQSKLVDFSIRQQVFIEDCEVCCNPIEFSIRIDDGLVTEFCAQTIEQ